MIPLQLLLLCLPWIIEIFLDTTLWKYGRPDKPLTTYIRVAMIFIIGILFELNDWNTWWQTMVFATVIFWAFFDYALNVVRFGFKKFFYVGRQGCYEKIRYRMTVPGELLFKIIVLMSAWVFYFDITKITG